MKLLSIFLFTLFNTVILAQEMPAKEKEANPYKKILTLSLSYSDEGNGTFKVQLKNVSGKKLPLTLDTVGLEGVFTLKKKNKEVAKMYEEKYFNLCTTSLWITGNCELAVNQTIEWNLSLDKLVYFLRSNRKVSKQDLENMSVSFTLERLAFPETGKLQDFVQVTSNTITPIPANKLFTNTFRMGQKEAEILGILDNTGQFTAKAMDQWLDTKIGEKAIFRDSMLILHAHREKLDTVSALLQLHRSGYKVPTLYSNTQKK